MLKSFRFILFPLSILYGVIIWIRNKLFDKNFLQSASFNFPIICVGNLSVGGTGKTPMAEYLVRLLKEEYKVATMSRGYKRKTKGFAIANENTTALDIGDEPMQLYKKFPDIVVSVAEERLVSIPQLLHDKPDTRIIILDDAFQHRQVKAGLNILLTEYRDMFTRDFILPAGNLRDVKSSYKRADIIIVTKCKSHLTEEEKNEIISEIKPLPVPPKISSVLSEEISRLLPMILNNPSLAKSVVGRVCGIFAGGDIFLPPCMPLIIRIKQ